MDLILENVCFDSIWSVEWKISGVHAWIIVT